MTRLIPARRPRPRCRRARAVGVLTAFRRRSIASAISAHRARTAHSRGIGLVFLEAEPEQEQAYRCTGFTDATTNIWASIR